MGKDKCCKNCGHCTKYNVGKKSERIECGTRIVDPNGICDRYQPNISPSEIMKKIDREIKRLEKMGDGEYDLQVRPPLGQNYRVRGDLA